MCTMYYLCVFTSFYKNKYWHFRGFYAFKFSSRETIVTCEIFKTEMISSPGKCLVMYTVAAVPTQHYQFVYSLYMLVAYITIPM